MASAKKTKVDQIQENPNPPPNKNGTYNDQKTLAKHDGKCWFMSKHGHKKNLKLLVQSYRNYAFHKNQQKNRVQKDNG